MTRLLKWILTSLSQLEVLIGAISHNISKASNVLESEDVLSTINSLRKLGVKIKKMEIKNIVFLVKD